MLCVLIVEGMSVVVNVMLSLMSVISPPHTHCQHNFHKHHTDGRPAEHTKGQDAQQLQALARRHSMQNHSKK